MSVSLILLVQLKHVPLSSFLSSILDLPAVFYYHFFFLLSHFMSFWFSKFFFFLVFFILKLSLPCSTCYYKWHPICAYLFFSVFPHCTTSWMGEMCLSLSLFSDLVHMAVLAPEFSSRVLGVISPSQDQIFVYFPLFLIYIF